MGGCFGFLPRLLDPEQAHTGDCFFEIHPYEQNHRTHDQESWPLMEKYLDTAPVPIWTREPMLYPSGVEYPVAVLHKYDYYFCSTFAYMIALAIEQHLAGKKITELKLFGVDMTSGQENRSHQRPNAEWYLGMARVLGIKVTVPPNSPLLKGYFYPGPQLEMLRDLEVRDGELEDEQINVEAILYHTQGRLTEVRQMSAITSGINDVQLLQKITDNELASVPPNSQFDPRMYTLMELVKDKRQELKGIIRARSEIRRWIAYQQAMLDKVQLDNISRGQASYPLLTGDPVTYVEGRMLNLDQNGMRSAKHQPAPSDSLSLDAKDPNIEEAYRALPVAYPNVFGRDITSVDMLAMRSAKTDDGKADLLPQPELNGKVKR
jgi:hypothetical protein